MKSAGKNIKEYIINYLSTASQLVMQLVTCRLVWIGELLSPHCVCQLMVWWDMRLQCSLSGLLICCLPNGKQTMAWWWDGYGLDCLLLFFVRLFCVFEGVAQSGAHLDWWMEHLLLCSQNILFVLAVALRSCVFVFILFLFIWFCLFWFLFLFVIYLFGFVTGSVSGQFCVIM